MTALRRGRIAILWAGLGALLAVALATVGPLVLGNHTLTVRSGSMSPAIETGDVVVTEPIAPLSARVGDIVTFSDPEGSGRLYSHRVQQVTPRGRAVAFVTRGDANSATEHWSVPAAGTIGHVAYRIPKLGYAVSWAGSGIGRMVLLVIPAGLLFFAAMRRIWRPSPVERGLY